MPATYKNDLIFTTVHDFKTHLSQYMRLLEEGEYKGVIVKRRGEVVGYYAAHPDRTAKVRRAGVFTRSVKQGEA